ncbi:MAG: PLDc N-terminal domain-containing protein [Aliarcobacter sp.]|jgi:ABC-type molybdate transport system permease subunit|nr:PLDc N-terminal domain-containing protein [Aliarcobacter sp.]
MESSASIFVSIIPLVVVLGIMVFCIYVLVDILKSEFTNSINKVIWLILVLVTGPLGIILYFFIGRKQKIQK